jgi:5-methylcytosine-specific restriction endonuclease McrA
MARCTRTKNLEVYHKQSRGDNDLRNAKIICETCHTAAPTYSTMGKAPSAFTEETKTAALKRAVNQCECTWSGGCH